jgi:hypothetical protein
VFALAKMAASVQIEMIVGIDDVTATDDAKAA